MSDFNKNIKLLVLDVDGVLTDGGMYYSATGEQQKKFNTRDGVAITHLIKNGLPVAILSSGLGNSKEIVESRAAILGIDKVYVGTEPKHEVIRSWSKEMNIPLSDMAYIGDDVNDLAVIQLVGVSACPSDAVKKIRDAVDIVLSKEGGAACVREFVEHQLMEI